MDTSPARSPGGLDWDEEPLFADEINSDDDDPPPLPAPLPPLSQLAQPHHDRTPHTMMGGGRGGGAPDWAANTQAGATAGNSCLWSSITHTHTHTQ